MYWIRISKADYSFTEGTWTLLNAKLQIVGSGKYENYPEMVHKSVVRNGCLYVLSYDNKGVYKINLANPADVALLKLGFTSANKPLGSSGSRM